MFLSKCSSCGGNLWALVVTHKNINEFSQSSFSVQNIHFKIVPSGGVKNLKYAMISVETRRMSDIDKEKGSLGISSWKREVVK